MSFTIERKNTSIIIKGILEKDIKIPSQMFPLPGPLNCIAVNNTEPFPDNEDTIKIKRIYNSIIPGIGTCYSNIEKLIDALNKEGIKATSYVGWIISNGAEPVHHCFAVIDNHILDFIPNFDLFNLQEYADSDIETLREKFAELMVERRKLPNSEYTTFGQVSKNNIYFASPCKPMIGLKEFNKLMKNFPFHPCYQNIYEDGSNKTQRLIQKKLNQKE